MALDRQTARYRTRHGGTPADLVAAQELRHRAFVEAAGLPPRSGGLDRDRFDAVSRHVLIEDTATGTPVCTFRYRVLSPADAAADSYTGALYDLAPLVALAGPMVELGRFCVAPGAADPDALRLAWARLTRIVDEAEATLLFGCASFAGADPARHADSLACLAARHPAPPGLSPGRRAPATVALPTSGDPASGWRAMPALLRTYLAMGGWTSDHAVIDREMDTVHVFTAVETARVPPARARALRALAEAAAGG
ncbi:GNAT family N-acetyltransferase [Wenxinia marina]|uniref:L-ornithine N(alpha)-acyltransferase n=1 Tax=Wenxinia marina DSM 24838 TaxID=1123501 RepID=A0A0D0NHP5_9RHOB|nr:GNAT family N-acetyltransferase [Wenxinia marina]KIQ67870.1 ornithine-acyl[acyl carrier protein] N-acyltransferase [Wenxinia marina DSM 24838]GGL74428.1 ornithine-acyl-ACP acyltransferase [Wenxinia marina]